MVQAKSLAGQISPLVQRQVGEEEEEPLQAKALSSAPHLQRKCPACESGGGTCPECAEEEKLQREPLAAEITPLIQRQTEMPEEEETLQTKPSSSHTPQVTPNISANINAMRGNGQPLPASARAFFEPRFGVDFSGVRVHTNGRAAETSRAVNARAFTVGKDVAFGGGQYAPESSEGRKLLAHELTHVVQQQKISPNGAKIQSQKGEARHFANKVSQQISESLGGKKVCISSQSSQATADAADKEALLMQRALRRPREVRAEITKLTGIDEIPQSVVRELALRLRLRRKALNLQRKRAEFRRRHYICFSDGTCGYLGTTESEYTQQQSLWIDQLQALYTQIRQGHIEPVGIANMRLAVLDSFGKEVDTKDAIRITETTITFSEEEGTTFEVETKWEQNRGFPSLPKERPHQGLVYLFVAVTSPT
ncbi:MAG: DUF4157 domain-containing protein, partial [candidate division KSB1 bacterium]